MNLIGNHDDNGFHTGELGREDNVTVPFSISSIHYHGIEAEQDQHEEE